jgi:quercetin dioxygenase-like cupin family protein
MRLQTVIGIAIGLLIFVGGASAQYTGGAVTPAAQAQSGKIEEPKGVKESNLMTSLGGFREVVNVPVVLTGQVITIEPGGQTGRQRHMVPTYVYVIDGTLVTNSFGGRVGVAGAQYHNEGQSYSDPAGVWHNHSNPGIKPVKYLLLFVAPQGAANLTEKAKADD